MPDTYSSQAVLVFFQFCDVAEVAIIQDPKFSQIWLLTTSERKKPIIHMYFLATYLNHVWRFQLFFI
jgi:hypothetical protein